MTCILTRAAAISSEPGLRALALVDDAEDDAPYLVRKCTQLLDKELDTPGITTAQSLQLLSEMHCAISHDTKGWMYAGGAGRLAYELGLHRDPDDLTTNLSQSDKEVRQVVFWSCFNLDRYVRIPIYLGGFFLMLTRCPERGHCIWEDRSQFDWRMSMRSVLEKELIMSPWTSTCPLRGARCSRLLATFARFCRSHLFPTMIP